MVLVTIFGFLPRDNVTNIFIANQTVSDLLVVLFALPFSVRNLFTSQIQISKGSEQRDGAELWAVTERGRLSRCFAGLQCHQHLLGTEYSSVPVCANHFLRGDFRHDLFTNINGTGKVRCVLCLFPRGALSRKTEGSNCEP